MSEHKTIAGMKKALINAMNGGEYKLPIVLEGNFYNLLRENLEATPLKPYIEDILYIIFCMSSIAGCYDYEKRGVLEK